MHILPTACTPTLPTVVIIFYVLVVWNTYWIVLQQEQIKLWFATERAMHAKAYLRLIFLSGLQDHMQ